MFGYHAIRFVPRSGSWLLHLNERFTHRLAIIIESTF